MNLENQTDYREPQPFEKMIHPSFFLYVYEQQSYLDAEFLKVANRRPSLLDRKNALLDERGEFYNETKRESRYWVLKSNDRQRLLEEYSDMLHFYMGIVIVEVQKKMDYLEGSGLFFGKDAKQMREEFVYYHHKKVGRYYEEQANLWIFKAIREEDRGVELDDVLAILSEGRRVHQPHQVIGAATLTMSLFGFEYDEIEAEYNRVRRNNYARIERTRQGLPDR